MRTVYGVSRWTNAHRPAARHINNGSGLPMCGNATKKKVFSWEVCDDEPTCKKCIELLKQTDLKQ